MPEEFIQAAFRRLEPTFRIGPVIATGVGDFVRALVPPPRLKDLSAEFVYRRRGQPGQPDTFPETPLTPVPPNFELPIGRALLAEGWVRVFQKTE